jgi:hypothetical protein
VLYYLPQYPKLSIGAYGPLAPALNSSTYASAVNSGPKPDVFAELFFITRGGAFVSHPYHSAGAGWFVQSPDNHLYGFYGALGSPGQFARFDYQGNPTAVGIVPSSVAVYAFFLSTDGNFYGLSVATSRTEVGIFRLTASGVFSWVVPSIPAGTYGVSYGISLIQAGNGKFYGTLPQGGSANAGSIYEATLDGMVKTIYEFPQLKSGIPETLLEASDGMLYGTARGEYQVPSSSIFRLNPYTGQIATIYNLLSGPQGACECHLIQGSDGKIYGTAMGGGTYGGGTIFALDAGLAPPKPSVSILAPLSGAFGQQVLVWGRGLLGATSVSFNGTPATDVHVASDQGIWVHVPQGATSGPITVTTANGTYTTTQSFIVN